MPVESTNRFEVRKMEKKEIKVSSQVETIAQAKELLADLEILSQKYEVKFEIRNDLIVGNYVEPAKWFE